MLKKITAAILAFIFIFSILPASAATDYDEVGAYEECYTLYPDFVNRVKAQGVTDKQIITFLGYVEKHLLSRDEELNEDNFDQYMFDAIKYAFELRPNIAVRNALGKAYPNSVPSAMEGVVTEEFMPIYDTVKRFLFGLDTPVITISVGHVNDETVVYAHSAHLPEDCDFVLAIYDAEGTLLHVKVVTPNLEEDGVHCTCGKINYAKLFAWDKYSLAPICTPYELAIL